MLCSEHFHPSDFFYQWGRKLLRPDAEPSVFTFAPPVPRRKPPAARNANTCDVDQHCSSSETIAMDIDNELHTTDTGAATRLDHGYAVKSPTKLTAQVNSLTDRLAGKIAQLRNARRRESRLRGTVGDLLKRLKNMQLLTEKAEEMVQIYKNIPVNLLSGKIGRKFTDEQKQFAVTLHYYSPAAYQYMRRRFKLLPCQRTIQNWLSSFDGKPGLTLQSFNTISEKIHSSKKSDYKFCALHIDEMEIKRHVDIDRHTGKVYGFTDLGSGNYFYCIHDYCKS